MRTLLTVPAVLAFIAASAFQTASADEWPDLLGEWKGQSRAIVTKVEHHYGDDTVDTDDAADETGAFASAELTVEITEQSEGRYIGTITSFGHTEPKYMVVAADKVLLRTSDDNGTSVGSILDENNFELCYAQIDPSVVSCVLFTRVE